MTKDLGRDGSGFLLDINRSIILNLSRDETSFKDRRALRLRLTARHMIAIPLSTLGWHKKSDRPDR